MYRDIDDLEGLRQGFSLEQRRPTGEHRLPIELKGYPYTLYNQWQWTRTQEKINDWLVGKERHYHYNPETKTNEEEIYYQRAFEAKHIKQFRVAHTFAWDAEKRQMHVNIDALSPMQERYDENGNFLSIAPIFSYQPHKLLRDAPKKPK